MNSPLYEYGLFGEGTSLIVALVIGFFFGLFLERGGLGNPHKLTGVFYFTDFTVPKVMFTAILVAASGLYLLSDMKVLDMDKVWIVPTYFWPQITGGFLFGLGFLVSGYCPGTSVAGLASGRIDALVTMIRHGCRVSGLCGFISLPGEFLYVCWYGRNNTPEFFQDKPLDNNGHYICMRRDYVLSHGTL